MRRRIKLILLSCTLLILNSKAQRQALIVKHMGISNSTIYPLIISTDSIRADSSGSNFRKNFLKLFGEYIVSPTFVNQVIVGGKDFDQLQYAFQTTIFETKDTTKFTYKIGSFDFLIIKKDTLLSLKSINNREIALSVITEFMNRISSFNGRETERIVSELHYILLKFGPNPTIKTTDKRQL